MADGDLSVVIPDFLAKPDKGDKSDGVRQLQEERYKDYTLKVFSGRAQNVTVCRGAKPVFFARDLAAAKAWVDQHT